MPAIELTGVVKDFPVSRPLIDTVLAGFRREWRRVLHGVTLAVEPGEVLVLVGPNGSGKSTCLSILAGLIRPNGGTARIHGIDSATDSPAAQAALGLVTVSDRGFYHRLDVRENLRFFAALHGLHGAEFDRRLGELGELLGFGDLAATPFRFLSAGQRARVALARGMLHRPSVLLLDEVTRSLDPGAAERFRRLVLDDLVRRERLAVLFTTHDLAEAERLQTRVALLVEGRIERSDLWDEVKPAIDATFFAEDVA